VVAEKLTGVKVASPNRTVGLDVPKFCPVMVNSAGFAAKFAATLLMTGLTLAGGCPNAKLAHTNTCIHGFGMFLSLSLKGQFSSDERKGITLVLLLRYEYAIPGRHGRFEARLRPVYPSLSAAALKSSERTIKFPSNLAQIA
jgi:hypothetical protein